MGQAPDIADVVALFASDDSRWVTGQTVEANGGMWRALREIGSGAA